MWGNNGGVMLVTGIVPTEQVIDVCCDVCGESTNVAEQVLEYATLAASWGYYSKHDGEQYQVHLCESCFFETLAYLRQCHREKNMFTAGYQVADPDRFGRINLAPGD
ncbi:hypothetical protein ACGSH8M1_023800 [Aeromonas caviae]|nr:hypothetical protein ACGSH8M1_023800 [Aeromonas caviae]